MKGILMMVVLIWAGLLGMVGICPGQEPPAAGANHAGHWCERETLTNDWFGLGERLSSRGITAGLSLTQVYQLNLKGGLSTHRRAGRYAGSYDLELEFDLQKLLNLAGASIYISAEGSFSDGLDGSSVGSIFGLNADAAGDRSIDLTQFYYEQALLGERLRIRVGKLDLSGGFDCRGCPVAFDCNAFANDETAQFLNGALVNNPTIPFPDNGLGIVAYLEPLDGFYLAAGVADAQADKRETGLNTTFHDEDYFFSIFEMGIAPQIPSRNGPLQGTYRIGFWYDPQDKDYLDGSGTKRDDVGLYLSFDQMIRRESDRADDDQGLGVFARYGLADEDVNEVKCFWSLGAQYKGLIPSRDNDVLGLGAAQGSLSEAAGLSSWNETVLESYYNIEITPWLHISPSVQYIANPSAGETKDDAVVVGFRAQMSF